jgi:RNA polymerase sigma-70 factor (ECF subfamily)
VTAAGFANLLGAARRGDEPAFGLLWHATNPVVVRYLRVLVRGRAAEVAERTWPDLVAVLRRFDGTEAQWRVQALSIARGHARQAIRSARGPASPATPSQPQTLDEAVTGAALSLLAALPSAEAEALALRTCGRLSIAETAQVLQLGRASVRTAVRSGLARAAAIASTPAARERVDRGERAGESPGWPPGTALDATDLAFEDLLAGHPVRPGAPRQMELLAAIVAALTAPPAAAEMQGSGAAYVAFRRQFAAGPRYARLSLRLGSRAAVIAGAVIVGVSGTLAAAYGGVLPARLQDVAHDWIDAPAPASAGSRPDVRPGQPAPGPGKRSTDVRPPASTARSTHRRGGTGHVSHPGTVATGTGSVAHVASPGSTRTASVSNRTPPGSTKTPPGSTRTPPGSTRTPPGSTKTPPGSTKTPPGSTKMPPGSTKAPGSGISRGSRAAPGNGTGGAASTSSSTRSAGSARG